MRELPEKRRDDNIILNEIIRVAKLEGVKFTPEINRAMQGIWNNKNCNLCRWIRKISSCKIFRQLI